MAEEVFYYTKDSYLGQAVRLNSSPTFENQTIAEDLDVGDAATIVSYAKMKRLLAGGVQE